MAYSKTNKDKIKFYKNNPKVVYEEYIVKGKTIGQLSVEWDLPKSTVYNIVKSVDLVGIKQADKITSCNEKLFNVQNPVFCYLAGLISADGYIDEKNHRVVIRMSVDAKDILEKIKQYFDVSNDVAEYSGVGGYTIEHTMYNLTISSEILLDQLRKLNVYGRKKDLLTRFPDMNLLTDECQEMYIRGLWDGDGTIRNTGVTSIFEESEKMVVAITTFLQNKLSMECTVKPRIRDNRLIGYDMYSTNITGRIFYKWLYRHNLDIKIDKKYKRQF